MTMSLAKVRAKSLHWPEIPDYVDPSTPTERELCTRVHSFACALCGHRIAPRRLHFVLGDRSVICGACVSIRVELPTGGMPAPLVDRVATYGTATAVADWLAQSKGRTAA